MHELTPEDSERVKQIKTALEEELRMEPTGTKAAIQDIEDLKLDALAALRTIMKHSANDSLKGKVAMWTYDTILSSAKTLQDEPIIGFLKELDASHSKT